MINPNIIIPFDGLHANIPDGFIRDTRFDSKFPKGAASGFGDTGGATTHTHTSPTHYHADVHTHTFTTAVTNGIDGSHSGGSSLISSHYHTGTTGAVSGGNTDSVAVTYSAFSNNPPLYSVIFIKSIGYNFIPVNGIILHAGSRDGLSYHSASSGRFLMGAATGANAGTNGGSTTNIHTITHEHTASAHSHANINLISVGGSPAYAAGGGDANTYAGDGHVHVTSFGSDTSTVGNAAIDLTTTETVEPKHCKIRHYKATAKTLPKPGDIALTTETTNPIGWITCDGENGTPDMSDYYVKNVDGEFDNNSDSGFGANSHSHAAQAHNHIGSSHNGHSMTVNATNESARQSSLTPQTSVAPRDHSHAAGTMNSASSAFQNTNTTANSASNEPEYIKVKFIQLKYVVAGGALLAIL